MKIAQFQTRVFPEKEKNLRQMEQCMEMAAREQADLAVFGEMFCCPYETGQFPLYAEPEGGEIWQRCSRLAEKHGIYLAAGTMPETDAGGHIYNTAYLFDRQGRQIGKHRKVHLFDIDIRGGQRFRESDTLTAGEECTVVQTEFGKIGICICFDFRFPEIARQMAQRGAVLLLVPAAFNPTTGPAHWELMNRSRAVDNQCFVAATSPARDPEAPYQAWGHSLIADPWGTVLGEMDEKEGMQTVEIDLREAARIREELPLLRARRPELYARWEAQEEKNRV